VAIFIFGDTSRQQSLLSKAPEGIGGPASACWISLAASTIFNHLHAGFTCPGSPLEAGPTSRILRAK